FFLAALTGLLPRLPVPETISARQRNQALGHGVGSAPVFPSFMTGRSGSACNGFPVSETAESDHQPPRHDASLNQAGRTVSAGVTVKLWWQVWTPRDGYTDWIAPCPYMLAREEGYWGG